MRYIIIAVLVTLLLYGCQNKTVNKISITSSYFDARDAMDFGAIKEAIHDSITIIEGNYVMPYDHKSFYEAFRWDSIFRTEYKVINIAEEGDDIIVKVQLQSMRNNFLENEQMVCPFRVSFENNKISKILTLDCKQVDWTTWAAKRDTLVNWIKIHHPELDGFVNDMTIKGAQEYVEAIRLFKMSH